MHNILEFVNTQADLSQERIEERCRLKNNTHFINLDECAKNICSDGKAATDNTLPVTLEAIANLDTLPPPDEVNGVDLKELYRMLASLSAGYPINELDDGPTKEFLKQCYNVSGPHFVRLNLHFYFESFISSAGIDEKRFGHGNESSSRRPDRTR